MGAEDRYGVVSVTGETGALHVWTPGDGTPRATQTGCTAGAGCATLLGVRCEVVSAASNRGGGTTLVGHDLGRTGGGPSSRCGGPETTLLCVAASACGGLLAAGGRSGMLYVWHASTGRLLGAVRAHLGGLVRVRWAAGGAIVLTGGTDGLVHAWRAHEVCDATRARGIRIDPATTLRAHALPVVDMAVGAAGATSASGARLATLAADRTARLWRLGDARCTGSVALSAAGVAIALAPGEDVLYIACADGAVVVAPLIVLTPDTPTAAGRLRALRVGGESVACSALALAPTGREVLVGYADGAVRSFDATTRSQLYVYRRHIAHPITALLVAYPPPPCTTTTLVKEAAECECECDLTTLQLQHQRPTAANEAIIWAKSELADAPFESAVRSGRRAKGDAVSEVWTHVEGPEWDEDVLPPPPQAQAQKPDDALAAPPELLAELAALRSRNAALEAAGAKLCEMLETLDVQ